MIDPESEEQSLLEAVRRELSPTAADVSRVLRATQAKLAAGSAGSGGEAASEGSDLGQHAARLRGASPKLVRPWLVQIVGALSIAATSGVIGYALGRRSVERPAPATSAAIARPMQPEDPAAVRTAPREIARAARTAPSEVARPAQTAAPEVAGSVQAVPREVAQDPAEALPRTAAANRPAVGRTTRSAAGRPAGEGSREATSSSLKEELDTMRRVDRLLHDREPRRALALLYELDRSVPAGQLMQEREAAFTMARCALELGDRQQLAREFGDRYPGSVYSARVKQLCLADQRIQSGPETHE
jgi:hypothetical protein